MLGLGMPETGLAVGMALLGFSGTGIGSSIGTLDVSDCSEGWVFLELGICRDFALLGAETGSDREPGAVYNFESLGTERGTLNFAAFARFGRLC